MSNIPLFQDLHPGSCSFDRQTLILSFTFPLFRVNFYFSF